MLKPEEKMVFSLYLLYFMMGAGGNIVYTELYFYILKNLCMYGCIRVHVVCERADTCIS